MWGLASEKMSDVKVLPKAGMMVARRVFSQAGMMADQLGDDWVAPMDARMDAPRADQLGDDLVARLVERLADRLVDK